MKALGWWLMMIGSARLALFWLGFFDTTFHFFLPFRPAIFSKTTVTDVHRRTLGVFFLLSGTLCFLCAFNLGNKPLYLATFLSFIYGFGYLSMEYLLYNTMALGDLTSIGIFVGTAIVWMLLQWNAHKRPRTKNL